MIFKCDQVEVQGVQDIFSTNFQYFATSPSPALGCYRLYRKWPVNRSDCTLISCRSDFLSYMQRFCCSDVEKKHNCSWIPCSCANKLIGFYEYVSLVLVKFCKPLPLLCGRDEPMETQEARRATLVRQNMIETYNIKGYTDTLEVNKCERS